MLATCLFSSSDNEEKGRLDLIIQFKTLEGKEGSPRHRNQSVGLLDFWQSKQGKRLFSKTLSRPVNVNGSVRLPPMFLCWRLELVVLGAPVQNSAFKYAFMQQYRLLSFHMSFPCSRCRGNGSATKDPLSPGEDLHGLAAKTESWSGTLQPGQYVLPQLRPAVPDVHPPSGQLPALA